MCLTCKIPISDSIDRLAELKDEFCADSSLMDSCILAESASACFLPRSALIEQKLSNVIFNLISAFLYTRSREMRASSRSLCRMLHRFSATLKCSWSSSRSLCSSSIWAWSSLICSWYFLMFFWASALALLAWSKPNSWVWRETYIGRKPILEKPKEISSSLMSPSNFFFIFNSSARPLASASKLACIESRARWWFFLNLW